MGNIKKYIHLGIFFVICHSQYVGDDKDSKCKKLSIAEILELANFLISLQNTKINEIFFSGENSNSANSKNFTNLNVNFGTDNLNITSLNEKDKKKIDRKINYKNLSRDEQILICEDILSMNMKFVHTNNQEVFIIKIPLNVLNVTSLIVLFIFICFGSIYVWKIITKKKCLCKLCKNEYEITEKLSEGGFGEIYKVVKNNFQYILKRCKTEDISEADDILAEAKYLRNLEHKNIVKYIDDFIHIEFNRGRIEPSYYVIIVMEYCEGGDLKKEIDDRYHRNEKFTKKEMIDMLAQLCEGVLYLHNKNIIHRDIKSQNIFLTKDKILRIGDFGLAKKIKKNKRNSCMTIVGTDCYMAPEVVRGEKYGKPADVWSLGCIIYELSTLNFMWMLESPIGIMAMTKTQFLNNFLEDIIEKEHLFLKRIIKSIFIVDSHKRIKIETIAKKLRKERRILNTQSPSSKDLLCVDNLSKSSS